MKPTTETIKGSPKKKLRELMPCGALRACSAIYFQRIVVLAKTIFGKHFPNVMGKMVGRQPLRAELVYVAVLMTFIKENKNVTLNAVVMFINSASFARTHRWCIGSITAKHLPGRIAKHIAKLL